MKQKLPDIIELHYIGGNKITLFKRKWWDVANKKEGIHVHDEHKITFVNTLWTWYSEQPYILASQAAQVFYIRDMQLGNEWKNNLGTLTISHKMKMKKLLVTMTHTSKMSHLGIVGRCMLMMKYSHWKGRCAG